MQIVDAIRPPEGHTYVRTTLLKPHIQFTIWDLPNKYRTCGQGRCLVRWAANATTYNKRQTICKF